jgi:PPOX class probable F420-dependent enzyme
MDRAEALTRFTRAEVARMATVRPNGNPHVVPITFALDGLRVVTAIDHKPKSTERLQRLVNIESNDHVSLVVDHFVDEWTDLWWVRVDGSATIYFDGSRWSKGIDALSKKYLQYRERPPSGPLIAIDLEDLKWWSGTP